MRTLAFAAVKGGVGKTTTAVNVAAAAARSGLATVVWDLDPQAAACHLLDVDPMDREPTRSRWFRRRDHHPIRATSVPRLSIIPANTELLRRSTLASVRQLNRVVKESEMRFDLVMFDLPAGVDSAVESVIRAGVDIVVPIVPSMLSVRSYEQLRSFAGNLKPPETSNRRAQIRGFVNMVDPLLKRHADFVDELRGAHPEVLTTWIPYTVEIERACEQRRTVSEAFPNGRSALAFTELWHELSYSS